MLYRGPIFFLFRGSVRGGKEVYSVPFVEGGGCLMLLMNVGYRLAGVMLVLRCGD
jgi:hypothetical protein